MTHREDPAKDGSGNRGRLPDWRAVTLGIAGALFVASLLFRGRGPRLAESKPPVPEVRVRTLVAAEAQRRVEIQGTVAPKTEVGIVPEVAGKIVFVHSELKSGGIIGANETILQIDPCQCQLEVRRAQAAVDEAQVKLDTELARAKLAGQQWRQGYQEAEPDLPVALAELQVRQARAGLEWAQADLAMAQLKLERTSISLPFDVLVMSESVDLGRYVTVGDNLAAVCGIDAFEVAVTIDEAALRWRDVLKGLGVSLDGMTEGDITEVDVRAELGGRPYTWPGAVSHIAGPIDPVSQALPIVVEVPKPLGGTDGRPPLLPGISVEVLLAGIIVPDAIAVPREAIHEGDTAWLVEDGRLRIVSLGIAWQDATFAYVTSGLPDGAQIIVSSPDAPVDGMAVRVGSVAVRDLE